jgi:membrane-anchored protein YejM (alkaline phosphatase superfamily)
VVRAVRALATTRVSILRGNTVNLFDDPSDAGTVVVVGVPMSIIETARSTTDHADDRMKTIQTLTGRCNWNVDVQQGDRLLDRDGATYYQVTAVSTVSNPILRNDRRLDLIRVPTTS